MKRYKHSLNSTNLTTGVLGKLYPVGMKEVLPGDTFDHSTSVFMRLAPLARPLLHPLHVHVQHFFVPYRLIWDKWEDFIVNVNATSHPAPPTKMLSDIPAESVPDYLGLPPCPTTSAQVKISTLPVRAYNLIYNEYYRDKDIEDEVALDSVDVQRVDWARDYFTLARPWPVRGPTVTVPINSSAVTFHGPDNVPVKGQATVYGSAPVVGSKASVDGLGMRIGSSSPHVAHESDPLGVDVNGHTEMTSFEYFLDDTTHLYVKTNGPDSHEGKGYPAPRVQVDPSDMGLKVDAQRGKTDLIVQAGTGLGIDSLRVDLSNLKVASENGITLDVLALRQAMGMQRLAEARAQYGNTYKDVLRYYGVNPSDGRLDRPEYLGGGRTTLNVSEVLNTAATTKNSSIGDMKGHGITAMRSNRYRRFFEEHGVIITMLYVRPTPIYSSGADVTWFRTETPDQFYTPELDKIGTGEIHFGELCLTPQNATISRKVFGYTPDRFESYRHGSHKVTGGMRKSEYSAWHLARVFEDDPTKRPALNATFLKCNPSNRIWQDQKGDHFVCMVRDHCKARRIVKPRG